MLCKGGRAKTILICYVWTCVFFSKRSKKSPFSTISGYVEPRYKEPLYNEVLDITNDFLYPSNSKICEKEPQCNETSLYSERILPLPWRPLIISRYHCINTLKFCPLCIFYCVSLTSVFWNFFFSQDALLCSQDNESLNERLANRRKMNFGDNRMDMEDVEQASRMKKMQHIYLKSDSAGDDETKHFISVEANVSIVWSDLEHK